jgi:hypothetical protein
MPKISFVHIFILTFPATILGAHSVVDDASPCALLLNTRPLNPPQGDLGGELGFCNIKKIFNGL